MRYVNKKVFHIINGEFYSGAERVQDLLSQRLPDYGYNPCLACVKSGTFPKRCICDNANVLAFPMQSRFDFAQALRIGKYVRSNDFSLIHTHTPRTVILGYLASKIARVPLVHHLHSPTSRDTEHFLRNRVNSIVETFNIKKANRVIAVSESLKQYLVDLGVSSQKIDVVWNGVPSLSDLPALSIPRNRDSWVIGTLALFRPRKGLEILLQALDLLRREGVSVRLRAVGEFETKQYQQEIYDLASKINVSDYIEWVGFTQDVENEFKKIDIFVLPSLFGEGLPMVILEAMANGVPIVSTKIEGVPEAIPSDDFGCLVDPGDAKKLSVAIQRMIESDKYLEQVRRNAYQRQVDYLSDHAMAKGVANVYTKVLAE